MPATSLASMVAGTLVQTPDGPKPIEALNVGDTVLTYKEVTAEIGQQPVTFLYTRVVDQLISLKAADGDGQAVSINTTQEHPFYIGRKNAEDQIEYQWQAAQALQIGDQLLTLAKTPMYITELKEDQLSQRVFNIEVAQQHNYFVSKNKILVHNPGDEPCQNTSYQAFYGPGQKAPVYSAVSPPEKPSYQALINTPTYESPRPNISHTPHQPGSKGNPVKTTYPAPAQVNMQSPTPVKVTYPVNMQPLVPAAQVTPPLSPEIEAFIRREDLKRRDIIRREIAWRDYYTHKEVMQRELMQQRILMPEIEELDRESYAREERMHRKGLLLHFREPPEYIQKQAFERNHHMKRLKTMFYSDSDFSDVGSPYRDWDDWSYWDWGWPE